MQSSLEFRSVRKKDKLSYLVLNRIKDALVDGSLKPGERLPSVSELASKMDVGISSVREAIKMLEGLDVLESRQGEGTFVSNGLSDGAFNALSLQLMLMPGSINELVEFRRMYETAYTHMAFNNATAADFEKLEMIVSSQEKKVETANSPDAQDEKDFHFAVLDCTHNPYVIRLGQALVELFLYTIPISGEMVSGYSLTRDHRNILEALRTKDTERLNRVLEKSFLGWEQRLGGQPYVEQ